MKRDTRSLDYRSDKIYKAYLEKPRYLAEAKCKIFLAGLGYSA